jgi:uncharacterized membrane protein YkoI
MIWSTQHEQGPAREQGSEEAEEGARPESARPASKLGADSRERASTEEAVADPRRPGRRDAERRARCADEHDASALERVTTRGYRDAREIELKSDQLFEVKANNDSGLWIEMYVDARSGEILKQEIKSKGSRP